MAIDDSAAQDALDRLIIALSPATARVSMEMAQEVQREARAGLENPLGPLAESIHTTGPDPLKLTAYRTQVGPTLIYGRQRELGGPIDPVESLTLTAHHRAPGYWMWDFGDGRGMVDVFTTHVVQFGQHYLRRGLGAAMPLMLRRAVDTWGDALRSAF